MSKRGRVTHVKLTALGRATAESTAPDQSPRQIRDSIRRRYVEQYGPRSQWSLDLKFDEKVEVEAALDEVAIESLRLGRPKKDLTPEEFGAILEATSLEWRALIVKRRASSAHFDAILVRRIMEFVEQRDRSASG